MTQLKTKSKYKSIIHIVEAVIFMIRKFFPLCIILQTAFEGKQILAWKKKLFRFFIFLESPIKIERKPDLILIQNI